MRTKKLTGYVLLGMGVALCAAALLLLRHNRAENVDAGLAAGEALTAIQAVIAENAAALPAQGAENPAEAAGEELIPPLPVHSIDGHDYVGYLDIPDLELNLPVMKLLYTEDLQLSPCLETGSPYSDDAVIAAHNYATHFGRLKELKGGEAVTFTDMNGEQISYTVALVQTVAPTDVELVRESEHDLVLYTCTLGGQNRVMVACDRTAD